MRNNTNPKRRQDARAKINVPPAIMSRWPLHKIIAHGMKETREYAPSTLSKNRKAVRAYEQFIGHEQSAVNVTDEKLAEFRKWLDVQGYGRAMTVLLVDCVAAVVRFADPCLLPERAGSARKPFSDAEIEGSIEHAMISEYFPARPAIASDETRRQYGASVARFSKFLDRPAMLTDLNDGAVERWIGSMNRTGLQPKTIKEYVLKIRAFWKWAAKRHVVDQGPMFDVHMQAKGGKAKLAVGEPGTLTHFTEKYLSAREVSEDYAERLRKRAIKLEKHAGTGAIDVVLTEEVINSFLGSLDFSPYTVGSYRSDLLSLWNRAADEDLVPYPQIRRIIRRKCHELIVECYTKLEVDQLLEAAKLLKGGYPNGVAKRLYWSAAIRLAWDSGLRRGDVWRFKKSVLRDDGSFRVTQHKTGRVVLCKLRPATIDALNAIQFDKALEWPLDSSFFGRHFTRLVRKSGVNRGTFKWVRRASGSYVEMQQAGAGRKHLGQSSTAVFDKHYDGKLGGHTIPQPPALDDVDVRHAAATAGADEFAFL